MKREAQTTGLDFVNAITEDTSAFNLVDYYYIYNGAGVAVGDANNDSLPDLYFSGNMVDGALYLNQGELQFREATASSGIEHTGWETGVTWADVNGDGHLDLYVCRAGPYPHAQRANLLYVNDGTGAFTERAAEFGIADTSATTQAAFFDYDKDGDLDLFLLNHSNDVSSPNRIRPIVTDGTGPGNDRLYRNDGGSFTDVTVDAGIVYPGMSLGVGINDVNGDGWEDIYVANDFMAHDYLYVNNGDGTFSEKGSDVLKHHSFAAMGTDLGDINNDGRVDIMTVDMRPPDHEGRMRMSFPLNEASFQRSLEMGYHPQYWRNTLQLNNGFGPSGTLSFSDVGQYAGVDASGWSWAPLLADFDHDGWRDLWITNGYRRAMIDLDFIEEYVDLQQQYGVEASEDQVKEMANEMYALDRIDHVYRNTTGLAFEKVSADWGITEPSFSNGAAYSDLDNDGDLDMIINAIDQPVPLYENMSDDGSFLKVRLTGRGLNTHALGAQLRLYCDDRLQHRHHAVTRGYQSSVGYPIHFGLGDCAVADSLRVTWPDGATTLRTDVAAGQTLHLQHDQATPQSPAHARTPSSNPSHASLSSHVGVFLQPARDELDLKHKHTEASFNDFDRQRLLPHKHSESGPGVAVGDVNGDGREDVFIGGAFRQSGRLFTQRADGTFSEATPIGTEPFYQEDTGVLFFDADQDGDLDLYVASGSSEFPSGSEYLQDRLYLNDGRGAFSLAQDALPDLSTSNSTVTAADYDQDGDLDLFVGGRLIPGRYPMPPRSYLLRNDDGSFSDVTRSLAPDLQTIGMVTSALWTDFNTDGQVDLIVVGEFMAIRFLENRGGRFEDVTARTGLTHTEGWWNSIIGGDFDRDGDTDYVVGNLGLNTRYDASPSEPVSVYAADFDRNRLLDPLLTHYVEGKEVPVARRSSFLTQMPSLRRQFPDYESYATATVSDLFTPEQLNNALTLRATRFASSYLENEGDGRFSIRPLPTNAQLGPLYGLLARDVTGDGYLDVLAVGNSYAPDVITGRHDALIGVLLEGDGEGQFTAVPHLQSGFFVDGPARGLARLQRSDGRSVYLAVQNDDSTQVFIQSDEQDGRTRSPGPLDAYVQITFPDGATERRELYHGSGYLSQPSRSFRLPPPAVSVSIHGYNGSTPPDSK